MQVPHRVAPFTALVRRHPAVSAAAVALGVLTGVLLTVFLTGGRSAPRAANVSRNLRACLLDSPANSTDAALTRATWQGLRAAAGTGKVNAQRFTAPTVDAKAALPYINGAVQHHCGLIFAVGTGMRPATEAAAKANPRQQFVLVGTTSSHAHVSAITASDDAPGALADKVRKFVSARL
jgi:basic membrane lipoprotein Med (substrate-binding protein (PBP1-ABC) superfamily)